MSKNILLLLFILSVGSCASNKDIIVVGHRGAMGHALENTIESVKKAIQLNVDGIEIDVFKSKTGELVVYHDPFLSRLSNSNAFIEQISLDSIKKVELKGGLSIPTLNEVINIIPEKIFLNIELKGSNTAFETNKVIIEYLKEFNLPPSKFIISSFSFFITFLSCLDCPKELKETSNASVNSKFFIMFSFLQFTTFSFNLNYL